MTDEAMQPFERIAQDVREQVRLRQLKPGDKLQSTRELAIKYAVAPGTVQRAFADLRRDGVIYSHTGRGSFIRENALDALADPTAQTIKRLEEQVADLAARLERVERNQSSGAAQS
ncbi:GntR family transcriptional regulator [Streptomyces sp. CB01201]|uniref:GntR family transcriptional regulator n=1 Tax=Streptomyces sp. CB01201 TaxID=2020324 RepID=UPI00131AC99D|nr:GntR family transcriptional regulator [Streptomyces sp. CB01201]